MTTSLNRAPLPNVLPEVKHVPRITIDAFMTSKESIASMEGVCGDRRMSKTQVSYKEAGLSFAATHYSQTSTPNLIILEVDVSREDLFKHLNKLASHCPANTKVIVIGPFDDIATYRNLMDQGVSDYLVHPVSDKDLLSSISRIYERAEETKLGRISVFFGTRGGSGSSTIAHNVATILSHKPASNMLLIDLDDHFGTAALNLNIDNDLGGVEMLANQNKIDEGFLDRISVRLNKDLRVIGSGSAFDHVIPVTKEFVGNIVDAIHESACHAIIDLPTTWSEKEAKFLKVADDVILTATPDLSSMKNTKQLVEYCSKTRPNDPKPILVLNQIGIPKRPEINKREFASAVRLEPSAIIPFDANCFGKAANNGRTIYETYPKSAPARSMVEIADMLSSNRPHQASRAYRSLWGRLLDRIN